MGKLTKRAQAMVEYGLILALVAILAYEVLTKLSTPISGAGKNAVSAVTGVNNVQDYCRKLSPRASYDASTHNCSVP